MSHYCVYLPYCCREITSLVNGFKALKIGLDLESGQGFVPGIFIWVTALSFLVIHTWFFFFCWHKLNGILVSCPSIFPYRHHVLLISSITFYILDLPGFLCDLDYCYDYVDPWLLVVKNCHQITDFEMYFIFKKDFIFRQREEEGERERNINVWLPLCAPYWGPGPQPRHVPWLGIKPATLRFTGWHSIHWITPARAIFM